MAKENKFLEDLKARNLVDEREIAFMADVTATNGNSGRAWCLLFGTDLRLFATAGFAGIGELVDTLDLTDAEVLKASSFALHTSMKLRCGAYTYKFLGFSQAKKVIDTIREVIGN